ncbi:hypothetical protein [Moorena sp. SIO4G3]|nr:hypothetical protein [Moorena sp. SIO4G3]
MAIIDLLYRQGRWGDGEMGRWGDGEMGRWGDGERDVGWAVRTNRIVRF